MITLFVIAVPTGALAKPRPPLPPAPEFAPLLWHGGFDQYYNGRITNAQISIANYGVLTESWSGFSLQRSGKIPPFIVPALSKARTNIACESGALRLWIRGYWNSGAGPGIDARLITLATLMEKEALESWSLQVSADGSLTYLLAQRAVGAELVLKASIDFQQASGTW